MAFKLFINFQQPRNTQNNNYTTLALGEGGGGDNNYTTMALGEEGGGDDNVINPPQAPVDPFAFINTFIKPILMMMVMLPMFDFMNQNSNQN